MRDARIFQSLLEKAAASGADFDETFVKPIAPSALVAAVRKHLPLPGVTASPDAAPAPSAESEEEATAPGFVTRLRAMTDRSAQQAAIVDPRRCRAGFGE
ncbi:MAG TPA: hypothetical protein VK550_06695 [Polyangiaceae bacterium]|nr:hypothetical protein [Polyangiaceae bacterium]